MAKYYFVYAMAGSKSSVHKIGLLNGSRSFWISSGGLKMGSSESGIVSIFRETVLYIMFVNAMLTGTQGRRLRRSRSSRPSCK